MSDIKVQDVLEAYNGLIGNWGIASIISEIKNSWDREAITDLFRISASLITTIESQKEEIERLQKPALSLAYRVLKEKHERDAESYIEHINGLESQIESLKAITELAVKENEQLKQMLVDTYGFGWNIEFDRRISNEQT